MARKVRRVPYLPSDWFRKWVRLRGVSELARELGVNKSTVYRWIAAKNPTRPEANTGLTIISKAREQGYRLTHEDVFGPAK